MRLADRLGGAAKTLAESPWETRARPSRIERAHVLDYVHIGPEALDRLNRLSPRETEVLEMAALGLTNTQMAARLHVTVHAIKFHLAAVYRKLGVGNRTEAAVLYLRAARKPLSLDGAEG